MVAAAKPVCDGCPKEHREQPAPGRISFFVGNAASHLVLPWQWGNRLYLGLLATVSEGSGQCIGT